jgi:hypothetical protein
MFGVGRCRRLNREVFEAALARLRFSGITVDCRKELANLRHALRTFTCFLLRHEGNDLFPRTLYGRRDVRHGINTYCPRDELPQRIDVARNANIVRVTICFWRSEPLTPEKLSGIGSLNGSCARSTTGEPPIGQHPSGFAKSVF